MTTFIDFRYAKTLSQALVAGNHPEQGELSVAPGCDAYFAICLAGAERPCRLVEVRTSDGRTLAALGTEADRSLRLVAPDETVLCSTPPGCLPQSSAGIVVLRLHPALVGFKLGHTTYESACVLAGGNAERHLWFVDPGTASLLGAGTGRAQQWARLRYHRDERRTGLGVEIVCDWHHLRSGIPLSGTLTAEKLIEWTDFRLALRSYVMDDAEARSTDFARLFSSEEAPDISLHVTPPLYTRLATGHPNVGLFACEAENVIPGVVSRCNRMDSIIVPTSFVRRAYEKSGVRRPIHVVPHGVDLEFYRPVARRTPLVGGRGFNFLTVSTHVERKNLRHVVRAFLEEFRAHEDVALFLLSRPEFGTTQSNVVHEFDAWEKRYFRKSAPVLLSTGYVTRETLRDFYANANAYVLPSNEGFGLTLLEAMASATPVIGLDYAGTLDFLDDSNGYLVPRGRTYRARDIDSISYVGDRFFAPDIARLRAAMRHVFEHRREADEKGREGRRTCEARYSWDRTGVETARVLERTHAGARRRPAGRHQAGSSPSNADLVSWVLRVPDDVPLAASVAHLRARKSANNDVLCLFTRYARVQDILLARRNGFLFHRWDGTDKDCRAVIRAVIPNPWAGLLQPGERLDGDPETLGDFLASQPDEVCEVRVPCDSGHHEPRFVRARPRGTATRTREFAGVRIRSRSGRGREDGRGRRTASPQRGSRW